MLAFVYVIFAIAVRFVVALRYVALPFHFTPVGASLLYFGARRPLRQMWIPVTLMAATDLVLTFFVYTYQFTPDQLISWVWYAGAVALGYLLRERITAMRLVGASLGLSVSFFLLSNLSVWAEGTMYPMTFAGLVTCYTVAIPFFRNTLASDLVFTAVLFGLPALARATRERPVEA